MKIVALVVSGLVFAMQYRLWVGDEGLAEVARLESAIEVQLAQNDGLRTRNQRLEADVTDLKQGVESVEARARSELGMIGEDEVYYQFVNR